MQSLSLVMPPLTSEGKKSMFFTTIKTRGKDGKWKIRGGELGASWLSWLKQKFARIHYYGYQKRAEPFSGRQSAFLSTELCEIYCDRFVFQALNIKHTMRRNYFSESAEVVFK